MNKKDYQSSGELSPSTSPLTDTAINL